DGGGGGVEHRRERWRSVFVHGVREVLSGGEWCDPSQGEQVARGIEDRFKKASVESIRAQKLNGQRRRSDKRTQDPGKLAAEQKVAAQPGEEHLARGQLAATEFPQELDQSHVRGKTSEGNHGHLRKQK